MNTKRLYFIPLLLVPALVYAQEMGEEPVEKPVEKPVKKVAPFRLPDPRFLTKEKEQVLLNDNTLMPKKAIDDLSSTDQGYFQDTFPSYKEKGATADDIKTAGVMKKVLEDNTLSSARKTLGLDTASLTQINQDSVKAAKGWNLIGGYTSPGQRMLYWFVYERDTLPSQDEALKTLGMTDVNLTADAVKSALKNKRDSINNDVKNPDMDKFNNAARTLYALTIPLNDTKTIITNYKHAAKIDDNNFKEELQKLDDAVNATLKKDISLKGDNATLNTLSRARDRILYDMLEQIKLVKPVVISAITIPTNGTGTGTGTSGAKTGLEGALANLNDKLKNLATALKPK